MSKLNPCDLLPPIKRCPICRGNSYTYHEPNRQYYVACRHCGYKEGSTSMFDAIKEWNNRNKKRECIDIERYQHENNKTKL